MSSHDELHDNIQLTLFRSSTGDLIHLTTENSSDPSLSLHAARYTISLITSCSYDCFTLVHLFPTAARLPFFTSSDLPHEMANGYYSFVLCTPEARGRRVRTCCHFIAHLATPSLLTACAYTARLRGAGQTIIGHSERIGFQIFCYYKYQQYILDF